MASDDDEELAELRAARAARSGQAATLSELREAQRRAEEARRAPGFFDSSSTRPAAAGGEEPAAGASRRAGADGPVVVEYVPDAPPEDDVLRSHLPLTFGKEAAGRPNPAVGPPRPPPKTQPAVGPPRPPAVGPPRPPAAAAAAAAVGPGDAAAAGDGPPRPASGLRGGWMTVDDVIGQQQQRPLSSGGGGGGGSGDGSPPPEARQAEQGGGSDDGQGVAGPPRPPVRQEEGEDEEMVGPPRPPAGSDDDDDDDDDGDGSEGGGGSGYGLPDDPYLLPVSQEVALQGHARAVTCLDVEHSGSRLLTGSLDYTVRIFDFAGMKSDLRSFRELTPSDGHPVLALSWSPTGDSFLCVTGSAQPQLFDRDGRALGEFARGDMYIRDVKNTKGHITACTGGTWHPTDRFTAATCSEDGTVRVWDTHNVLQKTVVRPTTPSAARVAVTTCAYNSTGKLLAAGLMDGTLQVWGVGGKFGTSAAVGVVLPPSAQMVEKQGWSYASRPNQLLRGAHEGQCEVTGIAFSKDDRLMASRSMDGSMKLWDLRAFKAPLGCWPSLPTNYATTTVAFSPDQRLLLTGTAAGAGAGAGGPGGAGAAVFVDAQTLREVRRVGMPSHVAAVRWNGRINQIFVGVGDRRGGAAHVLYDPVLSQRGALAAAGRAPRAPNPFDVGLPLLIKTPAVRDDNDRKRSRAKDRMDPVKSRKPDPGATAGAGRAGRIGNTSSTLLTQHLLKKRGKLVAVNEELDPREAILRHQGKEDAISRLTDAYAKTQPKPIFAEPEPDEDEDE